MEATKLLKKDHTRVKMLFDRYEQLGDRAVQTKQEIFDNLYAEVDVHSRIEEEIFYPFVQKVNSAELRDMVRESTEEHAVVKRLLTELRALGAADEQFDAKFKVFKENLLHHAEEEEEGKMFPLFIEKVPLEQREELGRALEARKDILVEGFTGLVAGWFKDLVPQT